MVPDPNNYQLAEETIRILLTEVPRPFKPFIKKLITALMSDRLRRAMMYDILSPIYHSYTIVSEHTDPVTGRYHLREYEGEPWYFKLTLFARYSPLSWFPWAIGGSYPGDERQYKPEGYKIFEVGPKEFEGKGVKECERMRDRLLVSGRGGCSFKG
jgi:hypothetical protein